MKKMRLAALALLCAAPIMPVATPAFAETQQLTAEQQAFITKVKAIQAGLHPRTGDVPIVEAKATLHLGDSYYFLGPDDARKILVDAWHNPPSAAEGVLGLVFEKGKDFMDPDAWSAVVTYEADGYVSDEDARTADYAALLTQLKDAQEQANTARKEQGYAALHLVGWAQQPTYDATSHSVVWAKTLHADDESGNGLNYDVRLLGRFGVLSLNMLSDMNHLDSVRAAAAGLSQAVTFDSGARYADFVPDVDKKAGYGIAGLVAAGVGVAAAKKLGFLALALGFGKKFIALILVAFAAVGRFVMGLFGKRKAEGEGE